MDHIGWNLDYLGVVFLATYGKKREKIVPSYWTYACVRAKITCFPFFLTFSLRHLTAKQARLSKPHLSTCLKEKYTLKWHLLIPHSSLNFWQSLYHLCQNLSKVSVSRLLETFSTYITVWGALGMQLPHCLNCREREVQRCDAHGHIDTDNVTRNTDQYRNTERNTDQ